MTESVILRLLVIAGMVWFIASEWFHAKQLENSYNRGFLRARNVYMKHHSKFLDEIYEDIDLLQKEFMKLEQSDEARASKTRFPKNAGNDSTANDIESSEPSGEGRAAAGRD